jgi:hypothetical protein
MRWVVCARRRLVKNEYLRVQLIWRKRRGLVESTYGNTTDVGKAEPDTAAAAELCSSNIRPSQNGL